MNTAVKEAPRETITPDGEIVHTFQGGDMALAMEAGLSAAQLDQQVAMAHKRPRRIEVVMRNLRQYATIDQDTAEACMYSVPRAGKAIEGPSIRFAEIAQQCFGNCRSGARVVMVDKHEKFVEAEGVFHDLETNSLSLSRCRVRLVDRNGKLYNDDMILVASAGAQSRAKRNAILAGIPKPFTAAAYAAAKEIVMGDTASLANRRADMLTAFQRYGVTADQIMALLGVKKPEHISAEGVFSLRAAFTALKSGELTVEEFLGPLAGTTKPPEEKPTRAKKAATTEKSADEAPKSESSAAKEGEAQTNTSVASPSEGNPAAEPKTASLADARAMGAKAFKDGKALRSVPDAWRDDEAFVAHVDSFQEAWRTADKEATAKK